MGSRRVDREKAVHDNHGASGLRDQADCAASRRQERMEKPVPKMLLLTEGEGVQQWQGLLGATTAGLDA